MSSIGFIHKDALNQETISSLVDVKFTHACITGETGSGKTSAMINPNLDHRISLGHGVLIFDHKGNYHSTVKALAKRHERLNDVIVIGVPWGSNCNIIEDMDESAMVDFLQSSMGHSSDNKFWEQSAIGLALPILNLLSELEKLGEYATFKSLVRPLLREHDKSIASLHKITVSRESLERFNTILEPLVIDEDKEKEIVTLLKQLVQKVDEQECEEAKDELNAFMHFENAYKKFYDDIIDSNQMKQKTNRTFDNIITCLNGPITPISNNPYINNAEVNINDALNSGKIVVFLCDQLPEVVLASITKSIFQRFNERIADDMHRDVTIFIDEAQRVLNREIDLPIDTLREARVDVFLAFQSQLLLVEKIGSIKAAALNVNLTSKYYLKSASNDDDMPTEKLEPFSFLTNQSTSAVAQKAKPMFIEEKELFDAEYAYQKMIKAFEKYKDILPDRRKPYVLKFVPSIYDKGQISVMYKDKSLKHYTFSNRVSKNRYNRLKESLIEKPEDISFAFSSLHNEQGSVQPI